MEWTCLKDWWRLEKWHSSNEQINSTAVSNMKDLTDVDMCCCDECFVCFDIALMHSILFFSNRYSTAYIYILSNLKMSNDKPSDVIISYTIFSLATYMCL